MRTRTFGVVVIALVVASCASTSNVVPTGPDTYMVTAHGTMGYSSGPEQKSKAFEQAAAYCKQSGKDLETISATDTGAGVWGKVSSAEVDFRCVDPAAKK